MGKLTTHLLDIASGRPVAKVHVELWADEGAEGRSLVKTATTNADGRTDVPLLVGDAIKVGRYELVFHIGAYFAASGMTVSDPPYLDEVPIRIGIADAGSHYHVALLVSPWSYTTYRGS
jgi:5-hydroxyisourate hydrolase